MEGATSAHRINYKQDLPPKGGYQEILWQRTYPKTWANAKRLFFIYAGCVAYGVFQHRAIKKWYKTMRLEDNDMFCAEEPFLWAERDRTWLKLLRNNRAIEDEVMSEEPGWKTGTWYGEPIYYTLGERWWDPVDLESYAHSTHAARTRYVWYMEHQEYAGPHWYDKYLPKWINDYVF